MKLSDFSYTDILKQLNFLLCSKNSAYRKAGFYIGGVVVLYPSKLSLNDHFDDHFTIIIGGLRIWY